MDYNRDTPEYGELEAETFKQQGAVRGPMDRKLLQGAMAGKKMGKHMNLLQLGMQKRRMEHDIKMGEGQLAQSSKRLGMAQKKFKWDMKQQAKATNIAKFGVALNLAMGIGDYMMERKNQRLQDTLIMAQIAELRNVKKQGQELK
jgi:hypothetical protein